MVGNWSPGIGDPTIGGWITVLLYVASATSIWVLLKGHNFAHHEHDRRIWRVLLVCLIVLGLNKQLDLQSALTEIGRIMAHRQGWYENRAQVQQAFIAGTGILGMTLLAVLVPLARGAHSATLCALVGGLALVVFVMMRAASFHHVDQFLGVDLGGLKYNWIVEAGGLIWILVSTMRRRRIS